MGLYASELRVRLLWTAQVIVNSALRMRQPDRERLAARSADRGGEPALLVDRDRDLLDLGRPARQHRAAHIDVSGPRLAIDRRLDIDLRRGLIEVDDQRGYLVLLRAIAIDPVGVRALA